jgi:hypothetical protein
VDENPAERAQPDVTRQNQDCRKKKQN